MKTGSVDPTTRHRVNEAVMEGEKVLRLLRITVSALTERQEKSDKYQYVAPNWIFPRASDDDVIRLNNIRAAAMFHEVSVRDIIVLLVEAWRLNPKRRWDLPKLSWFTSAHLIKRTGKLLKDMPGVVKPGNARERAVDVLVQIAGVGASKDPLYFGDIDEYTSGCGIKNQTRSSIVRKLRATRIGLLY